MMIRAHVSTLCLIGIVTLMLGAVSAAAPFVVANSLATPPAGSRDCPLPPPATPAPAATTARPTATTERMGGEMALFEAAARGDTATIERLLATGTPVDGQDATGATALIAAGWANQVEAACRLIQAGADVNHKDETEQSAYLIATSEGYLELLNLTLTAGADLRSLDSFQGTGLIRAAERGHVEIVEQLLTTGIAVDHVNRLGLTALLEAIMFGDGGPRHTAVVQRLVEAGADVNLADGSGVTPLAHARQRGYQAMIALLENAGGR